MPRGRSPRFNKSAVKSIRARVKKGETQVDVAKSLDVSIATIHKVVNRLGAYVQ